MKRHKEKRTLEKNTKMGVDVGFRTECIGLCQPAPFLLSAMSIVVRALSVQHSWVVIDELNAWLTRGSRVGVHVVVVAPA